MNIFVWIIAHVRHDYAFTYLSGYGKNKYQTLFETKSSNYIIFDCFNQKKGVFILSLIKITKYCTYL